MTTVASVMAVRRRNSVRNELLENLLEVVGYAASSAANLSNSAAGSGTSSFHVIPIGRSPVWLT
jgi:hypothetical protein